MATATVAPVVSNLPAPQRILTLARNDRAAAARALEDLSLDSQVALLCETPLSQRGELLVLLPAPENVIPAIPEAELCFTVKAIGIEDSAWLLEYATEEQVVACLDLDAWRGTAPDRAALDRWLDVLCLTGEESFLRSVQALDPEVVVLYLKHRIHCVQKPDDDEGWQPPEGAQTLEGQFYFQARRDNDDIEPVVVMLRSLFSAHYWTYFRMMQGIVHELDSDNEEWALRWRLGRLEDLGFPSWDRAMAIYRHIPPEQRAVVPEGIDALDIGGWHLPVWIPSLPATGRGTNLLFETFAKLDAEGRRASLFGFVALANKVAVADRMELGEAESTPRSIAKAAHFASSGLAHIAAERDLDAKDVVRRVPLERLFAVGANLDPEAAKPAAPVDDRGNG